MNRSDQQIETPVTFQSVRPYPSCGQTPFGGRFRFTGVHGTACLKVAVQGLKK